LSPALRTGRSLGADEHEKASDRPPRPIIRVVERPQARRREWPVIEVGSSTHQSPQFVAYLPVCGALSAALSEVSTDVSSVHRDSVRPPVRCGTARCYIGDDILTLRTHSEQGGHASEVRPS
jgi:hypothetical protein